jgi:hypothetical protein
MRVKWERSGIASVKNMLYDSSMIPYKDIYGILGYIDTIQDRRGKGAAEEKTFPTIFPCGEAMDMDMNGPEARGQGADSGEDSTARGYVEYLLKNYHAIKRELQQLRLELAYCETARTAELPERGSGGISVVLNNVSRRTRTTSREKLEEMIRAGELELAKLDTAIGALEKPLGGVITDIYIDRLSWGQICARRYISPNTISRYKKRAMEQICSAFQASSGTTRLAVTV